MKFEDLHDVEIGDILECKDLGAKFKVVDIDMAARHTPILVEMLSGYATTDLTTGLTNSCRFDQSKNNGYIGMLKRCKMMNSPSRGNLSYEYIHNFSFMFCLWLLLCFRERYRILQFFQ